MSSLVTLESQVCECNLFELFTLQGLVALSSYYTLRLTKDESEKRGLINLVNLWFWNVFNSFAALWFFHKAVLL